MYLYKNETQIDMNVLTLQEAKACYAPEAIKELGTTLFLENAVHYRIFS